MLDIAGKLFERIIYATLQGTIHRVGDLSDNQYHFWKGRATIVATSRVVEKTSNAINSSPFTKRMCAVIALDVRNAFNSAKWHNIMLAIENLEVLLYMRRITLSFMTDWTLLYNTVDDMHSYNITGVSQGSLVGFQTGNVLDYSGNCCQKGCRWLLMRTTLPWSSLAKRSSRGVAQQKQASAGSCKDFGAARFRSKRFFQVPTGSSNPTIPENSNSTPYYNNWFSSITASTKTDPSRTKR